MDRYESGKQKARDLLADAREAGWDLHPKTGFIDDPDSGVFQMFLWKDDTKEGIAASWTDGVADPCTYVHDGRRVTLKTLSAVRTRLTSGLDVIAGGRAISRSVPFDPETAHESEVFDAVLGRHLVWVNERSGRVEEADVLGKKHLRIVNGAAGRPILFFVDTVNTGFRAVALDKIVRVS